MKELIKHTVQQITKEIENCFQCPAGIGKRRKGLTPSARQTIHQITDDMIAIIFPGCHGPEIPPERLEEYLNEKLYSVMSTLHEQVRRAFEYQCNFERCDKCNDCDKRAENAVKQLLESLPSIIKTLRQDIIAAYEGDPAARSTMEVVMSYPCIYAIAVYRIAHVLYEAGVPLIPRVMTEHAHSKTGIDIHPGAKIGSGFFIDHGTGVVIGETCVIGNNVKIYQGVTLGALSFEKDANGNPIKGIKRHPNVGDNVVIYAGATILGGDTTIGSNSEIGGNVWLIHSVPPNSKVYNRQPRPLIKQKK
jgi:serine O-acetyltransferase